MKDPPMLKVKALLMISLWKTKQERVTKYTLIYWVTGDNHKYVNYYFEPVSVTI